MRTRLPHLALLASLLPGLLAPLACSPDEGGGAGAGSPGASAPGDGPASFPVRLLALPDSAGPPALVTDDLSDLSAWWLIDIAAGTLTGAAGHPDVELTEQGLTLTRDQLLLVRFVRAPAGETLVLEARLDSGREPQVGSLCQPLTLALLAEEEEPADAQLVTGGAPPTPASPELTARVGALMAQAPAVQEASWSSLPDAAGLAQARAMQSARQRPSLRALMLGAPRAGTRFASVSLRPRSAVARLHSEGPEGDGLDPAALTDGPLALSLRISGERRNALVVSPGQVASLSAPVPAGARRLSIGVALRPGSAPGAHARWTLSIVKGEAAEVGGEEPPAATAGDRGRSPEASTVLLGQGEATHPADGPLLWQDVWLDWPAEQLRDLWGDAPETPATLDAPATPLTLRLSVEGEDAVAFGQPLVHAAPDRDSAASGSASGSGSADTATSTRRPNVLLVSLDTVRADRLSVYGYERETSPYLERFAEGAVVFEDCSSVGPYTLPTHATMLSGLLPLRHNVVDSGADRVNAAAMPWLPRLLAEAGWVTAAFTGGGFLSDDYGFAGGFDRFGIVDPVIHRDSEYAQHRYARGIPPHLDQIEERARLEHIADWLEDQGQGGAPWFAFLHTYAAHDYLPPEADRALFDSTPDATWGRNWQELQAYLAPDGWPVQGLDPAKATRLSDLYDACLRFTDRELGQFLELLERRGLLEHTVVVITSDHGEEFGEHGGLRHSTTLYQEMLHVPLVVRAPGVDGGRRVREPVSLTDLVPTLLALTGLPPMPEGASDGRDLSPLLRGERASLEPPVLIGHVRTLNARRTSLRVGPHKLIRGDAGEVRFPAAPWELFDLSRDGAEAHELLAPGGDGDGGTSSTSGASGTGRPARADLATWAARLDDLEAELRARAVEAGASQVGDDVLKQLRELGYVR